MDGLSGGRLNRKNVTESEHVLSVTNDVATFTKRACELQTASGHKQRPTPCFFPSNKDYEDPHGDDGLCVDCGTDCQR